MEIEPFGARLMHQDREEAIEGMEAGQFVAAIGHNDEEREHHEGAGEEAEEIDAGVIRPKKVVEQEDERPLCRQ
jgi:hypothetical protein